MTKEVEQKTTETSTQVVEETKAEKKPAAKKTAKKSATKKPGKKPLVKEGASAKETIEAKVNLFFESNKDNKDKLISSEVEIKKDKEKTQKFQ